MSKESKKISKEEKTSIVLKAVSKGEGAYKELAENHGVTVEEIRTWIRESGAADVNKTETGDLDDGNTVSLDASDDFLESVEYGATLDKLNYKRLVFWAVFGTALIILIITAIQMIHNYTTSGVQRQVSEQSRFFNIDRSNQEAEEMLNTFGLVDLEAGIYRIPVDSAISRMANESE